MQKVINIFLMNLILLFISCGSDSEDVEVEPIPVKFESVIPKSGSTIHPDKDILVLFTAVPKDLTVSLGTVDVPLRRVTITGPFPFGEISIELTWADGSHTLEYNVNPQGMVLISSGEFQMGSESEFAAEDEKPVHSVFVDAFYIDMHEVTVGEYRQFVEATGHREPEWGEIAPYAPTDQHPIVLVSWHDAMAYAKWAGKRLPTEAEWEKAARGGSVDKAYPWGNLTPHHNRCNYADKNLSIYWWADQEADDGYTFTAPVGSYPENDYGLFDMAGNVLEWCLDEYDTGFYAVSQPENPLSGANSPEELIESFDTIQSLRVLRGGSWLATEQNVRNSTRFFLPPDGKSNTVGFRCVLDLP